MKKYIVEIRKSYNDDYDNWIGDYIEAETEEEALEFAKAWLKENGYDGDVEDLDYRVSEYSI